MLNVLRQWLSNWTVGMDVRVLKEAGFPGRGVPGRPEGMAQQRPGKCWTGGDPHEFSVWGATQESIWGYSLGETYSWSLPQF